MFELIYCIFLLQTNKRLKSASLKDDAEEFYDKMLSDKDWSDEHVKVENEILAKMGGRSGKFKKKGDKDGGEGNEKESDDAEEVKSPDTSSKTKKNSDSSTISSDSGTCKTRTCKF